MHLQTLLVVFAVASIGQGAPVDDNVSDTSWATIQKRNPCDGNQGTPNLYVLSNQLCEKWSEHVSEPRCGTFCQLTTRFTRAQESPFPRSECEWPGQCSLSEGDSTSWNWGSVGPQIGKALEMGISGGYGETSGTSKGTSWSFTPDEHECGYFTFIPTKKTTCGTLTMSKLVYIGGEVRCSYDVNNTQNYCADQVWAPGGVTDGVVIVKIDCTTRQRLPKEVQDLFYSLPGVPLDQGAYDAMTASWLDNTCMYWRSTTFLGEQNAFEIHGKNFDDGLLGTNGEQLKQKIEACGLPQGCAFAFAKTPDDPTWNWKASGCLPLTAKPGCIGDAIMAVGGRTKDGCT